MGGYGAIEGADAHKRRHRWAGAAAVGGLCLVLAVATYKSVDPLGSTTLSIRDENIDDAQVVECVSKQDAAAFATALGAQYLGWTMMPNPVGAGLLMDRGAWSQLRGGSLADYSWEYGSTRTNFPYDWTQGYGNLILGYDDFLANYQAGNVPAPEFAGGCDFTYSGATGCAESCVEDAFMAYDGGAYASCMDPVEAAFTLTPDLIKQCVDADSDSECFNCVSLCIGGSRAVMLNCGEATSNDREHVEDPDAGHSQNSIEDFEA